MGKVARGEEPKASAPFYFGAVSQFYRRCSITAAFRSQLNELPYHIHIEILF